MITADQATRPVQGKPLESANHYSSKIIKAGALLSDTKSLLAHWDLRTSVRDNLDRIRRENLFGKASRSRVEDILAIFHQRYLGEESVLRALVTLVKHQLPTADLDRILYFHAARSDRLLHDIVAEVLVPMKARGVVDIDVIALQRTLAGWVEAGLTTRRWGESTITRVAQGLLATLRDFGVLEGAVRKRIVPTYLPIRAFAYVMLYLKQHQPSGVKLIEHPDWRLFFLSREDVERSLFEAHQQRLLEYHAAGSVVRLTFPAETLEDYAYVLTQRAD
jgi:hypothetical protein